VQHQLIEAKTRLTEHQTQLEHHQLQIPPSPDDQRSQVSHVNSSNVIKPASTMILASEISLKISDNSHQLEQVQNDWISLQLQISQDNERKEKALDLQQELDHAYAAYLRVDRMASPIANITDCP